MRLFTRSISWPLRPLNLVLCLQANQELSESLSLFHFELCEKQMNAMLRVLFYVVQHEEWAFPRDNGEDHHL